ncbi:MAG: class I SAM-dependent methyltransferase [Comamonadaceae bacterium]|uniref:methyltransferase domain-containing protein n=1 Tax=Candidatus Skiveiella danica TaxID=3386177 RepID=UPI003908DB06|nr:class I SAM-dependent methyltransferase [Comamonadaceae bacterium]
MATSASKEVVQASTDAGASRVLVADIILNELQHARTQAARLCRARRLHPKNATAMEALADGSVDANVIFFLLHELPLNSQGRALREACRVLARAASSIWPNSTGRALGAAR